MKYLAVAAVALLLASMAYAEDTSKSAGNGAPVPPALSPSVRHHSGRSFDGGITSGFTTALSSVGTIGVLGLILLGILLLPSILSVLFATGLGARRAFDGGNMLDMNKSTLLSRLTMIHEAWQKFDVKDAQCRKRFICEVHAVEPDLGPTARKVMKVMDYISNVGISSLPDSMQPLFKEYVESMRVGKEMKECTKYASCPYSFANQVKSARLQ